MERAYKWLLLVLVIAEVALVRLGIIDLSTAIGVVIGIEALLLLVAGRQIFVAIRRYRRDRAAGLDLWAAAEEGLAVLLPRPVARLAVMEPLLWSCLGRWVLRRHKRQEGEFPYHKRSMVGVMLILVLFTTPVEVLLFELLIPWEWLRWLLLAVAVYALVWAFAWYASLVVLPHRLEASGVRIRYGALAGMTIPYAEIANVELARRRLPGAGDGLRAVPQENAAYLAINGQTDVTLSLRAPRAPSGVFASLAPVTTVHLATDEPQRLVEALSRRLATAA